MIPEIDSKDYCLSTSQTDQGNMYILMGMGSFYNPDHPEGGVRLARKLQLSDDICAMVEKLEKEITEGGSLKGKDQRYIGAISVYTVCSGIKTSEEIGEVAKLSESMLKVDLEHAKDIFRALFAKF
jgi:transcription initiation factor TFIIIB Brf1 subunit/transcription initiation factor TFIIB